MFKEYRHYLLPTTYYLLLLPLQRPLNPSGERRLQLFIGFKLGGNSRDARLVGMGPLGGFIAGVGGVLFFRLDLGLSVLDLEL